MLLRLQGLVLFLVLPLAIHLQLAQPIEPLAALLIGTGLLLIQPISAAPFVRRNLWRRCVWSGAEIAPGCEYRVLSGGGEWVFRTAGSAQRDQAARFFTFGQRFAWPLRIVFYGPLAYFVVMEVLRLSGFDGGTSAAVNRLVFQGGIGAASLVVFATHGRIEPVPHHAREAVRFPFPVQSVALLGVSWTLLTFAAVGAWWLASAIIRLQAA